MKVEGTHELHASAERVYQALIDPAVLQRCIPGCERLEKTGENAYSTTLRAGVGSIKGVFTGDWGFAYSAGETVKHELKKDRYAYVQVARGSVKLNGTKLDAGDGAAISAEKAVELTGVENTEVLLFDLA